MFFANYTFKIFGDISEGKEGVSNRRLLRDDANRAQGFPLLVKLNKAAIQFDNCPIR